MPADTKQALIEWLAAEHGTRLRAFFSRRVRQQPDVAELVQEVYLRMLRVRDIDEVENPEAYLYTVASNLAKEHNARKHIPQEPLDIDDPSVQEQLAVLPPMGEYVDKEVRVKRLREVLAQLSPKCYAAVVMHYSHGMSHAAIAEQLEISPHMVKKYLSQALVHCRRRMARLG
jgi:RNA polymerase sigma-70 factor (ECF subfamily)